MDGDGQLLIRLRNRYQAVPPGERAGQRAGDDVEVELERIELHEAEVGEARDRFADLRLAREPEILNGLHDGRAGAARLPAHTLRLLARERVAEDEDLEEVGVFGRAAGCAAG